MKLGDIAKANVPGVGKINLLNFSSVLGLLLGLFALAFLWTFATSWASKARMAVQSTPFYRAAPGPKITRQNVFPAA